MNDNNVVSVLAYVQAYFFKFRKREQAEWFSVHAASDSTCETGAAEWHHVAVSGRRQIACDVALLAKGFLYVMCEVGAVNPAYGYGL